MSVYLCVCAESFEQNIRIHMEYPMQGRAKKIVNCPIKKNHLVIDCFSPLPPLALSPFRPPAHIHEWKMD